jgi:predicted hydrocarbon binding protein
MSIYERTELGSFSSIVCFKTVITGMEEMLGEQATAISLKAAGRQRGVNLAQSLGFSRGSASIDDLPQIAKQLDAALGVHGTRLCRVDKIEPSGENIKVYTSETVCSAGEVMGSPRMCTFTLGAVHGAIEFLLDKQYFAKHTESVLRGGTHDVFEFTPR